MKQLFSSHKIVALSPNNKLFNKKFLSDFSEYQSFLKAAFRERRIRNIAITGNHGIGKSSIIRSYEKKDRKKGRGYLYISLMDFNDKRVLKDVHTDHDSSISPDENKQLQQEFERYLLCQILSRIDAQKLPHSTFKLIPSRKLITRIIISLLVAIFVACILGVSFNTQLELSAKLLKVLYYVCWGIGVILTMYATFIISKYLTKAKFSANRDGVKVEAEIEKTTGSYIDDHVFEIVYALETLASDIGYTVVLEDMDRLGRKICVDIFSKLRRINQLVNDRKKLKRKNIRFIYAFDDSVFELTKNTKFFDYVMSVTPKLNYNTAGTYFKEQLLKSTIDKKAAQNKIKDIISGYDNEFWEHVGMVIHDYRMINHILNDFLLFVKVMLNRNFEPNNKWLPFVIYKNVLAEDYCKAFEEKGILELEKEERNRKIELLCVQKGENYSEFVKLLFEYMIDSMHLNKVDFQQFTGVPQKVIDIRNDSNEYGHIKELLNKKIVPDNETIGPYLSGKKILITGGGGSVGSELCRQVATYDINSLIIVDISENNAYYIQQELSKISSEQGFDLHVEIASVYEDKKINILFEKYKPDIVFHAAAHKNVPFLENSPDEAVKNNILGTYNVIKAAETYQAERFVFISTDKAVNPSSIMGATKRFCELLIRSKQDSQTIFSTVRFGNLIGSNGSAIPLFERQIKNGGPITITHKDIVRYFMPIPQACQLILQTGAFAKQSQTYILDMGEPVKILSLAESMIRSAGLKPYEDIDIQIQGLRPGEKLYEELLLGEEGLTKTENEKIHLSNENSNVNAEMMESVITQLYDAIEEQKSHSVLVNLIQEIVPIYSMYGNLQHNQ